ncbi:MAG TPA: YigZ family protein [Puia sp.]|nr:YigZ family protein [Puia sp.]
MSEQEYYYTIETTSAAEVKDRGSKFIAYAYPVKSTEEFKERLNAVKKEHPKATHHCFAYRIGLEGNNFRVSDDGEPSGTAGRPILGQIDSKKLTNIVIIVIRYFGGTLLGVPGLINAYKSAAALVLQTVPIVQKNIEEEFRIEFDYTMMNDVMNIIKQNNCRITRQELQLFCHLNVAVPKRIAAFFLEKISDLKSVDIGSVT